MNTPSLPTNLRLLVPASQQAGRAVATLCEKLLNDKIVTIYLKLSDQQVERSFDRVDGAPRITCFAYSKIASVLRASLAAFEPTEQQQFNQLLHEVDAVVNGRQALRVWHDGLPLGDKRRDDNDRYEAFLNVMKEVRRILRGLPA